MQTFNKAFPEIKSRFDEQRGDHDGLICKQGFYKGCPVLKLQKSSWTNDRMDQLRNETGIFFSIWLDEQAIRKRRPNYNIHALKLRQLTGYTIASRDFANDFRDRFASVKARWPNVSVDYGPSTLMQGWIESEPKTVEQDALILMKHFEDLSPEIDGLLNERRKQIPARIKRQRTLGYFAGSISTKL